MTREEMQLLINNYKEDVKALAAELQKKTKAFEQLNADIIATRGAIQMAENRIAEIQKELDILPTSEVKDV